MFKRQGIIDLHMAWRGVNELDTDNLIAPDVNNAANALTLTASLWKHDVIEKIILYQSYWFDYKRLYEVMKGCHKIVPGYSKKCSEFILPEMDKAFEQMKSFTLDSVSQTTVN